jgi:hypothetical protein
LPFDKFMPSALRLRLEEAVSRSTSLTAMSLLNGNVERLRANPERSRRQSAQSKPAGRIDHSFGEKCGLG